MKGDPEFVILKYSAWMPTAQYESSVLGSIVRYPLKPTDDFTPTNALQQHNGDTPFHEGMLKDFVLRAEHDTGYNWAAALSSIAGFSFQGNTDQASHLKGKLLRYRRLTHHSKYWESLKTNPAVSSDVPGWISITNTWPPCLVVGIMIAQDVELDFSESKSREREVHGEIPIATIALAAAGVPALPGLAPDVGNLQAGVTGTSKRATIFKAQSGESSIFALELKIVTTKLLRSKELKLKEGGPEFDKGRMAGDDDDDYDDEDDEAEPRVENLVLENFTEKEFKEMTG